MATSMAVQEVASGPAPEPVSTVSPIPAIPVEELFALVRPRLERVLARFRIPAHDAEDLVQEALIHFLRKRPQINVPDQWLVGAVRKECLMYWRRRRRRLEVAFSGIEEDIAEEPPQEAHAWRADLDRAILTLRPRCRSLLRLRFALGYSTEEVAQRLGYRASSLDNVARRCLATLSQRLLSCTLAVRARCSE